MKPIIKRDLEEAFQAFQQWQVESEHKQSGGEQEQSGGEQEQSGGEQGQSGGVKTFSSGGAIRHCGPEGCK
jgi:hypothetical protein